MTAMRQDAWTKDEDLLLAEVVLRHIREGSTQLKAFEEVGKKLNRTAAACGFRWNSTVRKQYQSGIELAKKQRKEGKKSTDRKSSKPDPHSEVHKEKSVSLEEVIQFLQDMQKKEHLFTNSFEQDYEKKVVSMENRLKELERENEQLVKENKQLKDEYVALLAIMEKARKLAKTEEQHLEPSDERNREAEQSVDENEYSNEE